MDGHVGDLVDLLFEAVLDQQGDHVPSETLTRGSTSTWTSAEAWPPCFLVRSMWMIPHPATARIVSLISANRSASRPGVDQLLDRLPAELPGDPRDHDGDEERGNGIQVGQTRQGAADADQHDDDEMASELWCQALARNMSERTRRA